MNAFIRRHISEFVSLTVLLLMAVALVSGQADATSAAATPARETMRDAAFTASLDAVLDSARLRAILVIDVEPGDAAETDDASTDLLTISLLGRE